MNVVYSTSDLYAPLAGISLTSLLINNKDIDDINIFIMDNDIGEINRKKLIQTAEAYGRAINFIPLAESLQKININVQKWNISTFGRLFEASSLPKLDKVIHIDCDTVINGSLRKVWDLDMSKSVVAGAPDCLSDAYKINIGMNSENTYVNAGFLILNLKRIRELELEKKFLQYIEEKKDMLTYVDQEVLNACVSENEKIELALRYNSYSILHYLNYKELLRLRHVEHAFSEANFLEAKKDPIVVHFTGCFLEGTRPWIENDNHPLRRLFKKYKQLSNWKEINDWNDSRSFVDRFIECIVKLVPKFFLTLIVGYIHGVYIPNRNKKIQDGKR